MRGVPGMCSHGSQWLAIGTLWCTQALSNSWYVINGWTGHILPAKDDLPQARDRHLPISNPRSSQALWGGPIRLMSSVNRDRSLALQADESRRKREGAEALRIAGGGQISKRVLLRSAHRLRCVSCIHR